MTSYREMPWTLASASPRRLAILRQAGIEPRVAAVEVDEQHNGASPAELARRNARAKLAAVREEVRRGLVIAADTMVLLDGRILGKPKDREEARATLSALRNRTHVVLTAWVLADVEREAEREGIEQTRVTMREIAEEELDWYLDTGEAYDKAGAYGIQGAAAAFVERIDGCYFNVVGLPLSRVLEQASALLAGRSATSAREEDESHA